MKDRLYLQGLLLDGRRKSMQPMAGRLGVDHQQLQQFMTPSTWPVGTGRGRLARRAVGVVRPHVQVVDDTGWWTGWSRFLVTDGTGTDVVCSGRFGRRGGGSVARGGRPFAVSFVMPEGTSVDS
ncbi:hypothetical protein GCM10015535_69260 [Streptomyces gelaticus]|uniref:Transposase IS701-like DDE domain-containing protein n=1 Tax=Streptomyces gelaticus TaxID=285446 RepID=A0ABQ2W976_9ACTN|nr:hypothetical protein GCM10015535_69260 [Streptomyces gelaticus]